MDMRIPPVNIKILLGSNPLKSIILVRILAVRDAEDHDKSSSSKERHDVPVHVVLVCVVLSSRHSL